MSFTILHNPRCSKSRKTLNLLQNNGINPEIRLYLIDPLSSLELKEIIDKLNINIRELIRKGEEIYKTLNLNEQSLNSEQLLKIISENPVLIERPIVISGDKAIIGRPPENVLGII